MRGTAVPTCRFDPLGAAALHATTGSPAIELSACLSLITHPPPTRRGSPSEQLAPATQLSPRAREAHAHAKPVTPLCLQT